MSKPKPKPAGRPRIEAEVMKVRSVMDTDAGLAAAKKLGHGNASAGYRLGVALAMKKGKV